MPRRKVRARAPINGAPAKLLTLEQLDYRTNAAKLAIQVRDSIVADLGGADQLSTLEKLAAEQASMAAAVVNDAYCKWLQGQEISLSEIATCQNAFLRVASSLGFSRRAKDITKDISTYLTEQQEQETSNE
jgi:hypothetical protein